MRGERGLSTAFWVTHTRAITSRWGSYPYRCGIDNGGRSICIIQLYTNPGIWDEASRL